MARAESLMPYKSRTLEAARREIWTRDLVLASGMGTLVWVCILAISAPGSHDHALTPLQRLAFFAGMGAVCWPLAHALSAASLHFVRLRSPVALGLTAIATGSYLAANLCAVAIGLDSMFVPAPNELSTGAIYLLCTAISIPHLGLLYFVAWQRAKLKLSYPPATSDPGSAAPVAIDLDTTDAAPLTAAAPHARFLDRLPREVGRDLVYIKGKGHYLNVVTTSGTASVLMRFADAILELGGIGLRVHRSYWVADRHIAGIVRRNGQALVRLSNGDEVPVSRTYQVAVSTVQAARTGSNGGA